MPPAVKFLVVLVSTLFLLTIVAAAGSDSAGAAFTAAHTQLHLRRDPKADALDLMVSVDIAEARVQSFIKAVEQLVDDLPVRQLRLEELIV